MEQIFDSIVARSPLDGSGIQGVVSGQENLSWVIPVAGFKTIRFDGSGTFAASVTLNGQVSRDVFDLPFDPTTTRPTNLTAVGGSTIALGQAAMAASLPVEVS